MALVLCKECGEMVSSEAKTCKKAIEEANENFRDTVSAMKTMAVIIS